MAVCGKPLSGGARKRSIAVFGHRGARGFFPENTIPGFRYALGIGSDGIEIDVLLTKDRVPVVTHYPVLLAETARDVRGHWIEEDSGLVSDMSLAELQTYDVGALRAGSAHAARFPEQARLDGVQIPTLQDVAALLAEYPQARLNIEIKSYAARPDLTAPPDVMAREILSVVQCHGISDRTFVSSFDWRVLSAFRDQDAGISRHYLTYLDRPNPPMEPNIFENSPWMDGVSLAAHRGSLPQAIADIGGKGWCPHFGDLNAQDVERAHELGLLVNVWTVNSSEDISRMAELGADTIISDYPARVQDVLAEA